MSNTQEQWVQWQPASNLGHKYYIDSIIDSREGFRIILSEAENESNKIYVTFKNSVDAYRSTDESYRLKIMDDLGKKYGKDFYTGWTFFKVTNSEYINWLSAQSCGWSDELSFVHYSFVAADSIVDVVTNYEPDIEFVNMF